MVKLRVKKGDEVIVIAGKDSGKRGEVLRVMRSDRRVVVQGVNMVKRHEKPMPALGRAGGIIEKEASIHISNLSLVTADGQRTRVGYKLLANGNKARVARRTGEEI